MRPRSRSHAHLGFVLALCVGGVVSCAAPARQNVRLPAPIQTHREADASQEPSAVLAIQGPQEPRSLSLAPRSSAPTISPSDDFHRSASTPAPQPAPQTTPAAATAVANVPPAPRRPIAPAPIAQAPVTRQPTARTPIDAMVGQINGRPLFASEFFASMDARLRAEAERRSPEDWLRFARGEIRKALRDRIRDELLLAEVETSLTEQQRAGLVNFVRSLRDNFISQNRGSEALADRRFLEDQGITLEEAVQARRNEELIRSWLRRILQNKIYVPWRDVKQRYERDRDVYHPPAKAAFHMIRVAAKSTDDLDAVKQGLEANDDFVDLARQRSRFNAKEGGLYEALVTGDSYADSELFGIAALNDAAHTLTPGQVAGPIAVGANAYWLKLDSIDRISQSLYDVQKKIQQQLYSERVLVAQDDYFNTLLKRSGLQTSREVDRMEKRLFEIAAERYLLSRQN